MQIDIHRSCTLCTLTDIKDNNSMHAKQRRNVLYKRHLFAEDYIFHNSRK